MTEYIYTNSTTEASPDSMETLTQAILAGSDLLPFIHTGHHLSHCISYLLQYVNHRCEYCLIYL